MGLVSRIINRCKGKSSQSTRPTAVTFVSSPKKSHDIPTIHTAPTEPEDDEDSDEDSRPRITAKNIRDLRELIRHRYALDIEIWSRRNAKYYARKRLEEDMEKSDAALNDIRRILADWDRKEFFDSDGKEYAHFQDIKKRLTQGHKRVWSEHPPWEGLEKRTTLSELSGLPPGGNSSVQQAGSSNLTENSLPRTNSQYRHQQQQYQHPQNHQNHHELSAYEAYITQPTQQAMQNPNPASGGGGGQENWRHSHYA